MKAKAYSYLRVSGKGQIKGDGFTRQRKAISQFAKASKIELVDEFKDEGITGTADSYDRPGLSNLMMVMKANGIRSFIVENGGRLARDLMVSEIILQDCRKHGIKVLTADGQDLTVEDGDPTRVLIRQILASFFQFEKSLLTQKLAAARSRIRKATGKCEGRPSYGDAPGEKALIERLYQLRTVERLKIREICEKLTSEGILTRYKQTPFTVQSISGILKRNNIKKGRGLRKAV